MPSPSIFLAGWQINCYLERFVRGTKPRCHSQSRLLVKGHYTPGYRFKELGGWGQSHINAQLSIQEKQHYLTCTLGVLETVSTHMVLRLQVEKVEYWMCTRMSVNSTNECEENRPALWTLMGCVLDSRSSLLEGVRKASTILRLHVSQKVLVFSASS